MDKKDIKELLQMLAFQLEKGYLEGGCSTTETDYQIEYTVTRKETDGNDR